MRFELSRTNDSEWREVRTGSSVQVLAPKSEIRAISLLRQKRMLTRRCGLFLTQFLFIICYNAGMNDDQMTKLFKYMDDKFSVVDKRFDEMDHKFDQLQSAVDAYAKKADTYYQEMAAMDHKIRRLEKYIEALADKTGLDLNAIKI